MRALCKVLVSVGLAGLLVGSGISQQRGGFFQGGFGGMGGPGQLLRNTGVQKELKLSEEQIQKIGEVTKEIQTKHQDDFAKVRELPQEERGPKMREVMTAISEETQKALKEVLKPEQSKRLRQIELQNSMAVTVLTQPDVDKTLKLTDEQKEKIKTIAEDAQQEIRGLFQPGGDPQEGFKKIAALRKETMERAVSVLNADQKKAWKDMTGEPFEVKMERPFGRRGGADKDK